MEALRKLKEFFARSSKPVLEPITLHASGFSVGQTQVDWAEVVEISAYKQDRLTLDEAFIEFVLGSGQRVPVSEDQPGFAALEAALATVFPATAVWRQRVLQPAFARNHTVLYVAPNNSFKGKPLRGSP